MYYGITDPRIEVTLMTRMLLAALSSCDNGGNQMNRFSMQGILSNELDIYNLRINSEPDKGRWN
jgi:hypothetical protein